MAAVAAKGRSTGPYGRAATVAGNIAAGLGCTDIATGTSTGIFDRTVAMQRLSGGADGVIVRDHSTVAIDTVQAVCPQAGVVGAVHMAVMQSG